MIILVLVSVVAAEILSKIFVVDKYVVESDMIAPVVTASVAMFALATLRVVIAPEAATSEPFTVAKLAVKLPDNISELNVAL
jgi:hypothetical protein